MSVSYDQILQKMMKELQEANLLKQHPEKVQEHVRAVKLLADLIVDDDGASMQTMQQPSTSSQQIAPTQSQPTASPSPQPAPKSEPSIDHEEANGDSLFDF
ncbi:hypothetical protein GLW08_14565 [Pontibacillus yanchengensis]|uniref:Uncharacterized protein n=2 Tax=Pontibacillus yanchengensis TaxID=462910 RepID=A0ACC7VK44_9BACI|nr:YwdI family protein [Pontibacillus yanchengensis]MYL35727.1 hypothetical protein [Pontibacillus yanchengensis]MYL54556.1 hypothetical protein [Pontibacillus yanchengensis]